jgi:hypothetical protein
MNEEAPSAGAEPVRVRENRADLHLDNLLVVKSAKSPPLGSSEIRGAAEPYEASGYRPLIRRAALEEARGAAECHLVAGRLWRPVIRSRYPALGVLLTDLLDAADGWSAAGGRAANTCGSHMLQGPSAELGLAGTATRRSSPLAGAPTTRHRSDLFWAPGIASRWPRGGRNPLSPCPRRLRHRWAARAPVCCVTTSAPAPGCHCRGEAAVVVCGSNTRARNS